jgi:predicted nucleic acid-binding protein
VLNEVKRNAQVKFSEKEKNRLTQLILQSKLQFLTKPLQEFVDDCEQFIKQKDASVLAVAMHNNINYLVTLDKRDFLVTKVRNFANPLKILLPGDFIKETIL